MRKGKHEAAGSGSSWQKGGDPFAEEIQPKVSKKAGPKVKKAKAGGGWKSSLRSWGPTPSSTVRLAERYG